MSSCAAMVLPYYCNYMGLVGLMFHVDFAYAFGADPKPFAPPVKLSREMVEVMGGFGSKWFSRFKGLCFEAFSIARKSISGPLLASIYLCLSSAENILLNAASHDDSGSAWTTEHAIHFVHFLKSSYPLGDRSTGLGHKGPSRCLEKI